MSSLRRSTSEGCTRSLPTMHTECDTKEASLELQNQKRRSLFYCNTSQVILPAKSKLLEAPNVLYVPFLARASVLQSVHWQHRLWIAIFKILFFHFHHHFHFFFSITTFSHRTTPQIKKLIYRKLIGLLLGWYFNTGTFKCIRLKMRGQITKTWLIVSKLHSSWDVCKKKCLKINRKRGPGGSSA